MIIIKLTNNGNSYYYFDDEYCGFHLYFDISHATTFETEKEAERAVNTHLISHDGSLHLAGLSKDFREHPTKITLVRMVPNELRGYEWTTATPK